MTPLKRKPRRGGLPTGGVNSCESRYGHDDRGKITPRRSCSPRSFQCLKAWDDYRVDRLAPDDPRRRPTLAKVSIIDEPNPNSSKPRLGLRWRKP
jgi:hypothetical protein